MKKSIFLFFAAILCAMSVSAKVIYFKPNSNWAQANANFYAHVWGGSGATSPVKFTPVATDPSVYQAEIGTHNQVIFLRMDPSKTVTSSNMWNNPPLWNRMGNISIPTDDKNCCAINNGQWSQEKGTTNGAASFVTWSTYTPPTTVPDYYLTGTLAGGWNANDVKMTYDEATETYSHTFTAVAANAEQKFKVTNGTWSTSWGGAAISPAIDGITTDGDGNAVFTLSAAGNVTVTFKDSKIQVTTTGAFKVPVTYPYYILGTMNSWSVEEEYGLADEDEDGVYTREITLAAGEHFFKINIGKWDSQWGWSNVTGKYAEATDAKDDNKIKIKLASEKTFVVEFNKSKNQISFDGLTKIEDYYTVVGVAELFGEAWATANETNKMVKQGDDSYKLVKENVTLAAIGYDWKIAKNGDWWNDAATGVNPSGGGNNTLTITTAGRYNVTFTLAADLKSATVETELLEAAVVIPDCFISGNKNLTGKETEWQGNEFTMVYDEATETWSYTLVGMQPEKAYELKVVCGGTWYSYANLASVPTGVTEGNDHSIAFKMAAAGDVVVTYNVENGITLTGNFAEPVTYDYYLTGTLVGGWSAKQQGLEKDGELYKATFTELNAGIYEFKITAGDWEHQWNYNNLGAAYEEVSQGVDGEGNPNGNIKIVTEEAKNITVIFDATAGKITFEGLTEKAPEPTYDYYLTGSLVGGWDVKQQGIEKDGELYKVTFNALAAGTYEFKITAGDWEHQWNYNNLGAAYEEVSQGVDGEGNPNGNIKIVTEEAKNITVIFDATANKITIEGLTPYVAPLTYTVTVPAGTEKCYIAGSMNGWAFQEMEAVTGEINKFTITIVGAKETDEYKYACQADWAYAEVIDGGGNRTNWSELDEVTAWNKPVVYTYYLMGVNGDWTTGVAMEVNTGAENEVMLTCQPVNGEVKIKRLGDDASEYWYGGKSLKEDAGNLGTNTEAATDGDGNIALEEGIYNFYFNTADGKLWIAAATDCGTEPTPDYTRAVTPGNLGTICLPSNVPAGKASGATFYTLAGKDANGRIAFDEVNGELAAGVSYLFQATATEIVCFYGTESVSDPDNSGAMKGTFVDLELTELSNIYYFAKNALWSSEGDTKLSVPANRAYVDMLQVADLTEAAPVGVRRITLGVNGAQVATGVDQVQGDEVPTKMIINGQLYILRGEKMYDAQGKLVK